MKIQNIQQTGFGKKAPKQRFISNYMRASIESILCRMNSQIDRVADGDHYKTTIITNLHHPKGAVFTDERRLTKRVPFQEQMKGFSVLKLGEKTVLDIDNETGEIIDYTKPFYIPWRHIYNKAEHILSEMRILFGLDEIKKDKQTINELTPEGEKKVKKLILEYEQKRLLELTDKLEKDLTDESK